MCKTLTKREAEERNALSEWVFKIPGTDRVISATAMTENQARMFCSEKTEAKIGNLCRVSTIDS